MKKKILMLLALTLIFSLSMTSCLFGLVSSNQAQSSYLTKDEVQQMINNNLSGDITVEAGDNYDITINAESQDASAAAKGLLSVLSIDCEFELAYKDHPGLASSKKYSSGSGVIYKLDKEHGIAYIITNYHVVYYQNSNTANGISNNIKGYLYGQESTQYGIDLEYVGGSMSYDIAVLKTKVPSAILAESNAVAVEFADSDNVAVLDRAIAIGNPEDLGISATLGHVNVESEYITMEGADGVTEIQLRVMRMDTPVNSGNSGGGLFDNRGRLIGIVNAKLTDSENMSYALPSNFVKNVSDNIIYYCDTESEDGKSLENVYRCYLGITVEASELYTVYDKSSGKVLRREVVTVKAVESLGLANGRIAVGDIINSITVDGVKYEVTRMYIVTDSMLSARVGSTVTVNVTRGGESIDVSIDITSASLTAVK